MKWVMLLLSLLLSASYVFAEDFKDATADEVKKMIDGKQKMVLVDARGEWDYAQGHIPGSVNIPPAKLSLIQQYLPADKDVLLVFYCMSGKSG